MIGHPFFVNCVIAFFAFIGLLRYLRYSVIGLLAFMELRVKEEGTRNEE